MLAPSCNSSERALGRQVQYVAEMAYRYSHRSAWADAYLRGRLFIASVPDAVERVAKTSSASAAALVTSSSAAYSTLHRPSGHFALAPKATNTNPNGRDPRAERAYSCAQVNLNERIGQTLMPP